MKITPLMSPNTVAPPVAETGSSVSAERIARATAAMTGQPFEPTPTQDAQVDRALNSIKKIKLNTQRSTNRFTPEAVSEEQMPEAPTSDVLATSEPTETAPEATKPLSPQFAALAKAKRAAQAKEAAIAAREQAIAQKEADMKSAFDKLSRLKANPLSVLQEEGVTYDQLTESLLAQNQGNPGLDELKAEIKAMKEGFEQAQTQRDQAVKQQVLNQIKQDVETLVSQGDDYEMVRESGYAPKVVELIDQWFNKTGQVLDTDKACQLIENELLEESLKFAKLKKVQSKLTPTQMVQEQQQALQSERPNTKIMKTKTLTNRDGTSAPLSPRERAIAAFYGKLK